MAEQKGKHHRGTSEPSRRSKMSVVTGQVTSAAEERLFRGELPPPDAVHVSVLGEVADRVVIDELLASCASPRYVVTGAQVTLPHQTVQPDVFVAFLDQDGPEGDGLPGLVETLADDAAVVCIGPTQGRSKTRQRSQALGEVDYVERDVLSTGTLDGAIRHVLEVSRLRKSLRELGERFELMVRGANDGLWEWSILEDRAFFSQRWKHLLGLDEPLTHRMEDWFSRVHPSDLAGLRADIGDHLDGRTVAFENEHRVRGKDGSYRWVRSRGLALRDVTGKAVRMAGSVADVSDYRAREQAIRHQSRHDSLTGLPRREPFVEHLARAVELARQYEDYAFEVLLVEVDRLRMVNQSIGHDAGDRLLAMVAHRLELCLDGDELLARFGGAKFAILLQDVSDFELANRVADRIHQKFNDPFDIDGHPVYVTVSIGITSSLRGYKRVEDVISDMIAAATKAKNSPSHRREVFSADMRIEALSRMRLEMSLRQAVERKEFVLHYQPIVSLDSGYLIGFEALVRWNHPQRGLVPPLEFIPLTETTGLIIPVGAWVLEEAVRQLAEWHEQYDLAAELAVSVNLSGIQVAEPDLFKLIDSTVKRYGIPPGTLKIELTESVVMQNAEAATRLLQSLRHVGVQIWVDDFGTGYSSLSHLHRFPVDGLKIDKSFVDELDGTRASEPMVRAIIGLAGNLDLQVVAEGIEHRYQADQLRALGCGTAQGYYFGKPTSASAASVLLASGVESR